ncbi:hypothetical protein U2F26_22410 [Micromonospora sp. 4G57]|uniref:Acyltransferase 3 domain-containing protein n=1 Tax=Micromonospora sicca TaxID=2202420 RepID=A0ABU5JEY7_9ACTN|nr:MULTISPECIES: hypothetical protein [unclassified Micromonospora]MDZ5445449.1 hypothetical protein [Micromonospora sp. 4G57]MDZ5491141.1 hypothetical protein [Micromonospora sp. 4G53]
MTTRTDPTATTAAVAPTPADRVVWADVAKGACIVLVVLWHVVVKGYLWPSTARCWRPARPGCSTCPRAAGARPQP